jgi:hypothetical protein
MGLGGLRWAPAPRVSVAARAQGGGDDDEEGLRGGGSAACPLQQGDYSFTALSGPGCSRFLVRSMTASQQWRWVPPAWLRGCCSSLRRSPLIHEATDDGDFKIVVAHASGWRSWVVALPGAMIFLWSGAGEIHVSLADPDAVPPSCGTIPCWRASWESPDHCTLRVGGNPTVWSGQRRRVNCVSLLEGLFGARVLVGIGGDNPLQTSNPHLSPMHVWC